MNWDLRTTKKFETAAKFVRAEDIHGCVRVLDDLARHAGLFAELADLDVGEIIVHQVDGNKEAFGRHVLPQAAR